MTWNTRLGRIAGIDVFVHWTFLLLLAWIAISYLARGAGAAAAIEGVVFICLLFGCVVLHELGHALTARRFGIPTRDITLLPIGGVARLEQMPEDPKEEFLVAIAGPLVNVAIAGVLYLFLALVAGYAGQVPQTLLRGDLWVRLMWVNVALVVFNLLPAFPMDGGRILRALLATRMEHSRATAIAAAVGQAMALAFALVGLLVGNPFLIFIALFVYLGAGAEAGATQTKAVLRGIAAERAMMTKYRAFAPTARLQDLVDELLDGHQDAFPLEENGLYRGVVTRASLLTAMREAGADAPASEALSEEVFTAPRSATLDTLARDMQDRGVATVAIVESDRLVGLVSTENVGELLLVRSALGDVADLDASRSTTRRVGAGFLASEAKST